MLKLWKEESVGVTYYTTVIGEGSALPGDVDCNGIVDMIDVNLLSAYLLNIQTAAISEQGMLNANCNGDDEVSVLDLSAICAIILNG